MFCEALNLGQFGASAVPLVLFHGLVRGVNRVNEPVNPSLVRFVCNLFYEYIFIKVCTPVLCGGSPNISTNITTLSVAEPA